METDQRQQLNQALSQLSQILLGKKKQILLSMTCFLAQGHLLLEDLPGLGKTTLARALAGVLGLKYRRVQFTSDLLPADVTGFSTIDNDHQLHFHPGPVFTQLLLADEINRASPKSQSALLEAMEERQVTHDNQTHRLPRPFFVIATQNPLEQSGTFPLPESQLDRFLMRLSLGYPDPEREQAVLLGQHDHQWQTRPAVLSADAISHLHQAVAQVHVSKAVAAYVQKILEHSRQDERFVHGLSTRAGLGLIQAARALAFIQGQSAVMPQHIQAVFIPVAWHRLQPGRPQQDRRAELQHLLAQVRVPV